MGGPQLALLLVVCVSFGEAAIEYPAKTSPHCHSSQAMLSVITTEVRAILENVNTCGISGWRRVGFINMTDPRQTCPHGLSPVTRSGIRMCGSSHSTPADCSSTRFGAGGVQYSKVCGRIRAYQYGDTQGFYTNLVLNRGFEGSYVDGISLSHGPPGQRQHIWTFAAGNAEANTGQGNPKLCPCDDGGVVPPSFVGKDYFCESGNHDTIDLDTGIFFPNDPLWDGEGCDASSTCCQFGNPPYFTKTLSAPTNDDIELRLCHFSQAVNADVPTEQVELYVQ